MRKVVAATLTSTLTVSYYLASRRTASTVSAVTSTTSMLKTKLCIIGSGPAGHTAAICQWRQPLRSALPVEAAAIHRNPLSQQNDTISPLPLPLPQTPPAQS